MNLPPATPSRGMVCGTGGGVYLVQLDGGSMVDAALRGRLKQERRTGDKVVIGDRVSVAPHLEEWVVEEVEERRTEIVRRGPGGRKPKIVAANLDRLFIVIAAADPDPTLALVDRLLVVGEASGFSPLLVVNKVDLEGGGQVVARMQDLYGGIGYIVLPVSATSGVGLQALGERLSRGVSALIGPSGAGKSSLLNALDSSLDLRVGALSRKAMRGRHTTVSSRLLPLSFGGWVADTPGFGDVGLWGVSPEGVEPCFPEFVGYRDQCRFRGCAHLQEPDCGVRDAVARKEIVESRYDSYVKLRKETLE